MCNTKRCDNMSEHVIPFTQYIPPNGQKKDTFYQTPVGYKEKVDRLLENGYNFSCERLSTGDIALYCGKDEKEQIQICFDLTYLNSKVKDLIDDAINELECSMKDRVDTNPNEEIDDA